MLDQPFQRLPAEVEPVETGIATLQPGHDSQRLGVVVETAERVPCRHRAHPRRYGRTGVAKVMRQRQRLGQILVEAERAGERTRDLRHLDRMGQAGAVMVALMETKTCVLCFSRRKAVEWMIRSRSRWKSLRVGDAGSAIRRPRLWLERTGIGRAPAVAGLAVG